MIVYNTNIISVQNSV